MSISVGFEKCSCNETASYTQVQNKETYCRYHQRNCYLSFLSAHCPFHFFQPVNYQRIRYQNAQKWHSDEPNECNPERIEFFLFFSENSTTSHKTVTFNEVIHCKYWKAQNCTDALQRYCCPNSNVWFSVRFVGDRDPESSNSIQ